MDSFGGHSETVRQLSPLFAENPFVLIDVGCSGGIHEGWREFEPHLTAYGFEPSTTECSRLQAL